jgi:hypothetical protein
VPKFVEFEWAAFLYWVVSYGGNIGGDQDYVPLMSDAVFLERLRNNSSEVTLQEIRGNVILFLNRWKCMVKDDDATAEAIKKILVKSKGTLQNLSYKSILDVDTLSNFQMNEISALYSEFDTIPRFGPTATSKVMHILNPDLFVMWDSAILLHYRKTNPQINGAGNGYLAFLLTMSYIAREVTKDFQKFCSTATPEAFLCRKLGYTLSKSLAKFIDEYNWIMFTKRMPVPPQWSPERDI